MTCKLTFSCILKLLVSAVLGIASATPPPLLVLQDVSVAGVLGIVLLQLPFLLTSPQNKTLPRVPPHEPTLYFVCAAVEGFVCSLGCDALVLLVLLLVL